ncbi:hypothetical protein ACFL20_09355 [Spirochaetota bacterium]
MSESKTEEKKSSFKELMTGIVAIVVIWLLVDLFVCSSKTPKTAKELSKVKVVNHTYRSWGGIFDSSVHRIWVKNNTGEDLDWLELKLSYYGRKGKLLKEKEETFSGHEGFNDFGNPDKKGIFKKGKTVRLNIGKWSRNAYKMDNTVKLGEQSAVYLGDDAEKVKKVKVKILDYSVAEKKK